MYWGSRYCSDCKYNRNCYMNNNYGGKTECIILTEMFIKEYKKVNGGNSNEKSEN